MRQSSEQKKEPMTRATQPRARCLCQQLSLEIFEGIDKTSICHCTDCQARTGSIFGFQAAVAKDRCAIQGSFQTYRHIADSGSEVAYHSCPKCASTVFWEIPFYPDKYILAGGCLEGVDPPAPTFSVYEDRKKDWLQLPETITEHMA